MIIIRGFLALMFLFMIMYVIYVPVHELVIRLPFVKKYVITLETPPSHRYDYILYGVYGFSDKQIQKKIKNLVSMGYGIEDRFGNNRPVTKFPRYLDNIY